MNEAIEKNREFIIISPKVTNATKCVVTDVFANDGFEVELKTEEKYSPKEEVNLFAVAGSGVLYLTCKLEGVEAKKLTVSAPKSVVVIQRREYTRVELNKNILIENGEKKIRATIVDISAGGMRLSSETEMKKDKNYAVDISLDSNLFISCTFKPVRVVFEEENQKYNISGKFVLIKNIDRVALMQYCMKRQSEMQSK